MKFNLSSTVTVIAIIAGTLGFFSLNQRLQDSEIESMELAEEMYIQYMQAPMRREGIFGGSVHPVLFQGLQEGCPVLNISNRKDRSELHLRVKANRFDFRVINREGKTIGLSEIYRER